MKVKVIKAKLYTYWYADRIGEVFDVRESDYNYVCNDEYEHAFDKNDVEIINEEKNMFDVKKDKWFIYTPTPEISKVVQEWLFAQGFVWQHHEDTSVRYTKSLYLKLSPYKINAFCHTDSIDPKYDKSKEIKLTFKTVVDSVEYPEIQTPEKIQLDKVMSQIAELQTQAAKLQELINK